MGYIYKTLNVTNNRVYIGKSHKKIFDENYFGSGMLLRQSIKKHGSTDHLIVSIIEYCDNSDIDDREIYWIDKYKSKFGDLIYNLSEGGSGGNTNKYKSPEERNKIYKRISKKTIGRKDSPEVKLKKSISAKKRIIDFPNTLPDNKGRIHERSGLENIRNGIKKRIGEMTITDGVNEKKIMNEIDIPDGWQRGRSNAFKNKSRGRTMSVESSSKKSKHFTGKIRITNKVENKWICGGQEIPAGYIRGITKRGDMICK